MKQVAVFLAEGLEEIEGLTVVDVLRRAGIEVTTISISEKKEVTGSHNITILPDALFSEADWSGLDGVILPGGMPGTTNLMEHEGVRKVIQEFADQKKLVAAICAAPSVLGQAGLLRGKRATCYPGFEEQLVGVEAGADQDVTVTFPEEYHAPELAGKEAVFHCHIHEIKFEELPELDDEFAKDVSEYDTLDELKKATEERLQKNADAMALNAAKDAVIEKVYEANKPEVPAVMVEDEIDRMAQELDHQLRYQGLSLEQYLQFLQKEPKDFREELREDATKKVATRLVLMSIVEAEHVEVSEEDLETELKDMANAYNTDVAQIREMIGAEQLPFFKKDIQLKKVIDLLYSKAKVTKVEKKAEAAEEK